MNNDAQVELGAFAAQVAAALTDHDGELALSDADAAGFYQQARELTQLPDETRQQIALELLALCAQCLRLLAERAHRGCGQLCFIVGALTSPGYAEQAAQRLTDTRATVGVTERNNTPVRPAGSLATTPLGAYRSLVAKPKGSP